MKVSKDKNHRRIKQKPPHLSLEASTRAGSANTARPARASNSGSGRQPSSRVSQCQGQVAKHDSPHAFPVSAAGLGHIRLRLYQRLGGLCAQRLGGVPGPKCMPAMFVT